MTATDELRRLLDERGVVWTANDGEHVKETCWPYMGELTAAFAEFDNGTTRFACDTWCFTPEQAIAATLGAGTCHIEERHGDWYCTGCGEMVGTCDTTSELYIDGNAIGLWRFCPNCGRRVVSE